MNNNKNLASGWAILPLLFCSAAVLAGDGGTDASFGQIPAQNATLEDEPVPAAPPSARNAPDSMSQAQALGQESDGFLDDATETSSLNTGYVGGNTRIGIGVDSELKGKAEVSQVLNESASSATIGQGYVGFNPNADKDMGEETLTGAGVKLNHHWASGGDSATYVNKIFGAYDQNEQKDKKVTVGYGQENADLFWSGHVSKGISDSRASTTAGVTEKAYDLGVGGRVGSYLAGPQMRVQGGLDYEWGKDFADTEKRPTQTTLTGGVEKFFPDTPHSIGAEVEVYKKSGGFEDGNNKTETRGGVSYRYDIGSDAGIWQPEHRYRRVRVELPGEEIKQAPKVERKLVKNTMELEADTFFKVDSAKLTPEAQERMKAVLGQIRASGYEGNIRITGNTCDIGSLEHNQKLSERRANAVRDFMVKNGFNGNDLMAQGLGETQPKYPNTDAERHKNRRVDIEYVTYQNEYKNEVIEQGGTSRSDPKVVWRKELIAEPPLWVRQALRNVADHKQTVDTYKTAAGSTATNLPPTAHNDAATTTTGAPVTVDVLANDTDPNGDVLTIASFNQGGNGSVTKVGNNLVYTPVAGFTGTDTFTYVVADPAGNQSTATVTITVNAPTSNAPVANNDTSTTTSGTPVTVDVLANDTDPNGDTLSVSSFGQGGHGTVTQSGNNLVYTPAADFSGTDTFTYTVTDPAGHTATGTVTVIVNPAGNPNAPVANSDSAATTSGSPVAVDVLANDTDPNGDTLSISAFGQGSHGTVTQDGNNLVYTPADGFVGEDTFTYTVTDPAGNTATGTVHVQVAAGANMSASNDTYTLEANSSATALGILANDTVPAEGVTISIVTAPSHGSVEVVGNHVEYTPDADYVGSDSFTYQVTDSTGASASASVELTIGACTTCNPLKAEDDYLLIELNDTETRTLTVLDNDSGDDLKIVAVGTPRYGTATISSDGKSIQFTLRSGYCTDHAFTYTVQDKYGNQTQATVVIDIAPANTDPNSPPD
ncbi:Ig-like domain-containing protein [Candidatus Thiothrix sp. Deng01]|uniref:Ig-like domain-containing protein n=1 Tax=Candidatus Thiothrix phosphatis TaxID=3112415 RepID=A0ABU6CXS2_9GAMM|nr:Ig-like domain-containing protein [Candidatus Thiothrix sp. Deng01]MEB4591630.1 Ig-like domain-containing protein [Candidatus Thiothrix sp. Deng01]